MSITSRTTVELSDAELRAMVRAAIARIDTPALHPLRGEEFADVPARAAASDEGVHLHASHGRLPVRGGGPGTDGEDGACVIEPAVRCTHCGYCLCYGH